MFRALSICLLVLASLASALKSECRGATTTANLTINASVLSSANLTLGSSTLSFKAMDPARNPVVPALENPIPIVAKVRTNDPLTLLVVALDDLRNGDAVIPASAITWTASSEPFIGGTLNKAAGQPAALFPVGSGSYVSNLSFFLENSATYRPGTYSTTITYTLTTP